MWRGRDLELANAALARALLAAPLGLHGDEAVHVVLIFWLVRVPHLRARQTAPRHTAGHQRLRTAPECGRRQRNSLAAHLVNPRRVRNPRQGALKGQRNSLDAHLNYPLRIKHATAAHIFFRRRVENARRSAFKVTGVHLIRRGPPKPAQNPFQFLTKTSYDLSLSAKASWLSMSRLRATTASASASASTPSSTACIGPSNTILSFSEGSARHTGHVLRVPTLIQPTRHWK